MNSGERERESESVRSQSTLRCSRSRISAVREREKHQSAPFARTKLQSAPITSTSAVDRDPRSRSCLHADRDRRGACEITIDASRDRAVDRDLAFAPISISRSGAVLREIAIDDAVVMGLSDAVVMCFPAQRDREHQASIWVLSGVEMGLSFPCSIFQTPKNIFRKIF